MFINSEGVLYQGDCAAGDREATPEEIAAWEAERNTKQAKAEAQAYLLSTDWYVVRFAETGTAIPQEVTEARAAARLLLP